METPSTVSTTTVTRRFSFRSRRTRQEQLQRKPSLGDDSNGSAASHLRRGTALLRRLPRRIPRTIDKTQEQSQPSPMMMNSTTTPTSLLLLKENNDTTNRSSSFSERLDPAPVQKPPLPKATTVIQLHHKQHRSLPDALATWSSTAHELLDSEAFQRLLQASRLVVHQLGQDVVYIVLLPLTIPQHICATVTNGVMDMAMTIMETAMEQQQMRLVQNGSPTKRKPSTQTIEKAQHHGGGGGGLPGFLLGVTSQIVVAVVMPIFMGSPKQTKVVDDSDYLDKLRLDYVPKHLRPMMDGSMEAKNPVDNDDDDSTSMDDTAESSSTGSSHQRLPNHLMLRMDDLIGVEDISCNSVDLHPDHIDHGLSQRVLDAFVATTLQMFSTNASCAAALQLPVSADNTIRWHPECATKKLERQLLEHQHTDQALLRHETLVWSGKWTDPSPPRKPHTLYMARGIIPLSPLALLRLLWDNDRVHEYNPYCLERTTLLSLSDDDADAAVLSPATNQSPAATKIIRTVMRVAGLTVTAHNLMHVVPQRNDDDELQSYLLVGRTLDSQQRNEIVWGCNWLRPAGDGTGTELTSLSQVASSVPQFVAHKIGLNGIADFFRKVRGT